MTDYKLECEQPTVQCKFVVTQHQEFQLYIDLTLPELNQVQKGNYEIMELWNEKNPDGDRYDGLFIDEDKVDRLKVENKNPDIKQKWLSLKIENEVIK